MVHAATLGLQGMGQNNSKMAAAANKYMHKTAPASVYARQLELAVD
jgi:hypothetical protein